MPKAPLLVKIGWSSNPARRLADLQSGSPLALHLLGTFGGGAELEAALHGHFADHRVRGEWFDLGDDPVGLVGPVAQEERARLAERTGREPSHPLEVPGPLTQEILDWFPDVPLADTYIPGFVADAAPAVAQLDTGTGGIISRMADAGLRQTDVTEDVGQTPATADQAAALGVEQGELLLAITHTGRVEDGRAVEVTRHILGRGWTLRYGVPLD